MASSEASERGHGGERRAPYDSTGRGAPRAHGGRGAPRRGTPRRGCAGVVGRGGARRRGVVGGGVLRRERVREAPCTACASNSDAPSHVTHTHTHTHARAHTSAARPRVKRRYVPLLARYSSSCQVSQGREPSIAIVLSYERTTSRPGRAHGQGVRMASVRMGVRMASMRTRRACTG